MGKIILILVLMGMMFVIGCARTLGNIPYNSGDDYSTVFMIRESRILGFTEAYPIQINGMFMFRIGNGDCVTFKIPTGDFEIVCIPGWKRIKFLAEKGKKYYLFLREKFGPGGPEFRQLTDEEWNQKQKACNWVELK
jgi:hypothetical protein